MRKASLIIGALVLALLLGSHTLSLVAESRAPAAAAQMLPTNGRALAELSDEYFKQAVLANEGQLPDAVDKTAIALARQSYGLEPLNAVATRMLALNFAADGKDDEAIGLMQLTARLTKRERVANYWLAEKYGEADDVENLLTHYDMLLRTNSVAVEQLIPVLTDGMSNDAMVEPMGDLLRRDPPWAFVMWNRLVRLPNSLVNAAKLRIELADTNISTNADSDKVLMSNLVKEGHYSEAMELRTALVEGSAKPSGIVNGDFARAVEFAPVDWDLISEGDRGASINPGAGELNISALPDSFGLVARQLVQLGKGSHVFNANVADDVDDDTSLKAQLRCTGTPDRAESRLVDISLAKGETNSARFTSSCEYYWLELAISNDSSAPPADIVIREMSITPAS